MLRRQAGADQTDPFSSKSMNHNPQTSIDGQPDDHEALIEDGARLGKPDAMLSPIRRILSPIPLESDSIHLSTSLANRE